MSSQPRLKLPTAATTAIFRRIERQLRNDKALGRVVNSWTTWEGCPSDRVPNATGSAPLITLTPQAEAENWWAPSTQKGTLLVRVDMLVTGTCVDDVLNLWWAIQRACYPSDSTERLGFQGDLQAAGAHTGLIRFSQPAFDSDPAAGEDGQFLARGELAVEFRFDHNPTLPGY